jgi:hypothetical protein
MGNSWYISPLNAEHARHLRDAEGLAVPAGLGEGAAPTPNQVFALLPLFPEYEVRVRRRDRGERGEAVSIELRTKDGGYAIDINLLGVRGDDAPASTFVFDYYRGTEELIRLATPLAAVCGPLVLWHDGGERSEIIAPP